MKENFDIEEIIEELKSKRKVFTSEADLQLELAQIIKNKYKNQNITVRLEYCPDFDSQMHIDILVVFNNKWIPIELKYKTRKFDYTDKDGCHYNLKEQSAQDCGCYDYIKDISRIEKIRDNKKDIFKAGYTIFITNDELYKKGPRSNNVSYAQFSLKDGRENGISGTLKWNKNINGECTNSIELKSKYNIKWDDFSQLESENNECENSKNFYILYNKIEP